MNYNSTIEVTYVQWGMLYRMIPDYQYRKNGHIDDVLSERVDEISNDSFSYLEEPDETDLFVFINDIQTAIHQGIALSNFTLAETKEIYEYAVRYFELLDIEFYFEHDIHLTPLHIPLTLDLNVLADRFFSLYKESISKRK